MKIYVNYRYGRKFAHFTEEGKATLRDNVPPVFRITRKRKASSTMVSEELTQYTSYTFIICYIVLYLCFLVDLFIVNSRESVHFVSKPNLQWGHNNFT